MELAENDLFIRDPVTRENSEEQKLEPLYMWKWNLYKQVLVSEQQARILKFHNAKTSTSAVTLARMKCLCSILNLTEI